MAEHMQPIQFRNITEQSSSIADLIMMIDTYTELNIVLTVSHNPDNPSDQLITPHTMQKMYMREIFQPPSVEWDYDDVIPLEAEAPMPMSIFLNEWLPQKVSSPDWYMYRKFDLRLEAA